ncbi:T9SS type A sorting domain-containing protein [Mariniflexile gromovii]|uniref:T9SS type A sorting domain-containing protein n=1 Tax=Mariniflexile gromovii TaxID=362523 RepID=A0ABS4BZ90_9FLAO|nr:T9SS type A sorting domain-containing protein [Mariniflexile gromovii]MBP0905366.1 T9SS type A sorting domain-containing protein [Mariniflexile gromovii]
MQKKLQFLLAATMLCTANLISAQGGINHVFTDFGGWIVGNNPERTNPAGGTIPAGTSAVSGGHLNVTMGGQSEPFTGSYRSDVKFDITNGGGTSSYTINSNTDKILAIKFIGDRVAAGTFKLEMYNLTAGAWMNNSGSRYTAAGTTTTAAGNKIYYFDFSTDANFTAGNIAISRINFTIADNPNGGSFVVDWIASFADIAALEAYKEAKDDGTSDTEGSLTLGIDDVVTKNNAFKIYPNPSTNNSFNIELEKSYSKSTATVKVYNLLGSVILSKTVNTNVKKTTINHNLNPGMYIVQVDTTSTKLVVK